MTRAGEKLYAVSTKGPSKRELWAAAVLSGSAGVAAVVSLFRWLASLL